MTIWDNSYRETSNVLKIKSDAEAVQNIYRRANTNLPLACELSRFIEKAKAVADSWISESGEGLPYADIFSAMHMKRLAQAIIPLNEHPDKSKYLRRLTAGEVDFFKRVESSAKNALWELELWSLLQSRCPASDLQDPPDIVLRLSGGALGIACKKIYSERNVEKVLSQAVRQVKDFEVGIAALNIDDLTPADTVLRVNTEAEMARLLQQPCEEFLQRHERHFRKYLSKGRLVAALVSIHVIADVKEWKASLNNSRQSVIWTIPGLSPDKESLLEQFRQIVV
jgi:hypothetical protein